ncbi:MAG: DEAD/DEAH box helicase [Candidatus Marsarchaeota archaeon]|jgi:Fanconi anemia group M protein|nr:DEAD/DEAH box helicase [Candidatus Marsarchaeota archaeon]MCL5111887.1 DEAD/DEAH box helicase [Candidatus Marsarchaeota archaeon]
MPSWDELGEPAKLVNTQLVEPRAYQINIAKSIMRGYNSLVVLPTGLGKTLIAVLAMANALSQGKKAIILAPTKPLSEQHYASLSSLLKIDKAMILLLTGGVSAKSRAGLERDARAIAATPQTIANDLKSERLSMEDAGIVVFDECHRAVGRYAYTYIADECKLKGVQLLGLTASPGSNSKKINALVSALGIENIEIRISSDSDVMSYVMDKSTNVIHVEKEQTMDKILSALKLVIDEHLGKLYQHGLSPFQRYENMGKSKILMIGAAIDKLQSSNYKFMAMYNYVYLLNLSHAYDLLATEGFYPFIHYLDSLKAREKKSRAVQSILNNETVVKALIDAREAVSSGIEHPKIFKIIDLMSKELKGKSVMVFVQYRSTIRRIVELLNEYGIAAHQFVGKKDGVTQAHQKETIEMFREGKFNVLVASSIGEEGLDIPSVDAVIFYEPIPSEIRNIQRRGRAGRIKFGEIYILATKGTKDEIYLYISRQRERKMYELVERARLALGARKPSNQRTL